LVTRADDDPSPRGGGSGDGDDDDDDDDNDDDDDDDDDVDGSVERAPPSSLDAAGAPPRVETLLSFSTGRDDLPSEPPDRKNGMASLAVGCYDVATASPYAILYVDRTIERNMKREKDGTQ
jgi:hypothetical protein